MRWIEKPSDLDTDLLRKFENLINNIESTWNLLTVKALTIGNNPQLKIAIANVGYIDLQKTDHGAGGLAIVLTKRDLDNKIAQAELAFCKMDPTSKNIQVKKYNSLYHRGLNIIYRTINTALFDAYDTALD